MSEDMPKERSFWAPSPVVGITVFQDRVFVACERGVYELKDGVLEPLLFVLTDKLKFSPADLLRGRDSNWVLDPPHRPQHAVKP